MTEGTVSPATTPAASPGFFGTAWGILVKPKQTFATLRASSSRAWIMMAILSLILVTLPIIAGSGITAQMTREATQAQLENQPSFGGSGVNVDQAVAVSTSPIFTIVLPAVGTTLGRVIGWLIWSGALYLLASMVGGSSTFLQMLKVNIWAWLPFALRSILQAIYIAATQTLIANPGLSGFAEAPTPDSSNPFAAELPSTGTAVLQAFLGQIDIYLFWHLALLVLGITAVAKLSRRKSMGLVLIVWVVFMAVRLIGTAVTTNLASGFIGG